MIVVMNRIPVNVEYAEAFEKRFAERISVVKDMEGFVSFYLLRPHKADDPYVATTFWESHDHFVAWTQSSQFKEGHTGGDRLPPEAYRGKPKLEVMDIAVEAVR